MTKTCSVPNIEDSILKTYSDDECNTIHIWIYQRTPLTEFRAEQEGTGPERITEKRILLVLHIATMQYHALFTRGALAEGIKNT